MLSIARKVFKSNTSKSTSHPSRTCSTPSKWTAPRSSKNTRTSSSSAPTTSSSNSTSRHTPTCPTYAWQSSPPTSPKPSVKASITTTRAEEITVKVAAEAPEGTHPEALAIEAMRQCPRSASTTWAVWFRANSQTKPHSVNAQTLSLRAPHLRCPGRSVLPKIRTQCSPYRANHTPHSHAPSSSPTSLPNASQCQPRLRPDHSHDR